MNLEEVKKIIKEFEDSELRYLELELDNVKIKISKNNETVNKNVIETESKEIVKTSSPKKESIMDNMVKGKQIKSPLVGTFYQSSNPNGEPLVSVGQRINKGDIICIVEAMKIMNEITSPYDGIVESIHFENGDTIGYDDVIITLSQNDSSK